MNIKSYEIISLNPQVVKINDEIYYGFFLLHSDEKIISIIPEVKFFNKGNHSGIQTELSEMSNYQTHLKNIYICCITSLNNTITLFNKCNIRMSNLYSDAIQYSINNIIYDGKYCLNFNIKSSKYDKWGSYSENLDIDYKVSYCKNDKKYIIMNASKNGKNILPHCNPIDLILNEPIKMFMCDYNKDDDILNTYSKLKDNNDNIMKQLENITMNTKYNGIELLTLQTLQKKHIPEEIKIYHDKLDTITKQYNKEIKIKIKLKEINQKYYKIIKNILEKKVSYTKKYKKKMNKQKDLYEYKIYRNNKIISELRNTLNNSEETNIFLCRENKILHDKLFNLIKKTN
jgi:hypothetical protein